MVEDSRSASYFLLYVRDVIVVSNLDRTLTLIPVALLKPRTQIVIWEREHRTSIIVLKLSTAANVLRVVSVLYKKIKDNP